MKPSTLICATSALAMMLALPLTAEAGPRGGHRGQGDPEKMLAELDTNADGAISKEEIAAHKAKKFTEMDANKDGFLSEDEMIAAHEKKMADRKRKGAGKMIERLDTDKDGKVSAAEFSNHEMPGFDKIDTNKDGSISADERAAAKAMKESRRGMRGKDKAAPAPAPVQ
jgi:hypothetical protein